MKITRRPLNLDSLSYSREWFVKRSMGCHLMSVVEYIAKTTRIEKAYGKVTNLDDFAVAGFLWEHVMGRAEKLEHAMSIEALRMYMTHRPELSYPGERLWCKQCNMFMKGGKTGRKHCRVEGHRGIFFTPDAYDTNDRAYVEWKFTWKSSNRSHPSVLNSPKGIWRWPVQCMFNAYGLGTNKAKLIALHCMGDYRKGMPKPRPYEITLEFTDRELRRNHQMIVHNASSLGWI